MAGVFLLVTLSMTVARTCLVVDAVVGAARGGHGPMSRVIQTIRSDASRAPGMSSPGSPRKRAGPVGAGASKVRSLHRRLLCMHWTSILGQSAGIAKYMLPVSDTSCVMTHRAMLSMSLLYDASMVLFLLAKTYVTNGNRTLACWEKGVIWFTRVYGWAWMPFLAAVMGARFPGSANEEETFCFNGINGEIATTTRGNARSYAVANALLLVQFVLLLVLFLKPLLGNQGGTQSGGAVYRRIVLRNVVCTSCVVLAYTTTTVVAVFALLHESTENNKSAQVRDAAFAVNQFVTLCLMEIALPLGFVSCWKQCAAHSAKNQEGETEDMRLAKAGNAGTAAKVAPVEELSPRLP